MTLDLSQHGRARMNLPHGFVGLDVTADRLTLTVRHRHWWFWRRWRTHVLASVPWRIKVNDTVRVTWATCDAWFSDVRRRGRTRHRCGFRSGSSGCRR